MYQNYHKHDYYTNPIVPDSVVSPEAYALRAVELGHKILSSVNHGWAGRYIEHYELAKQYGLKFLFGTEAYLVKDRLEKDRTNAHIILLAKNENGRRNINRILSEASLTGYYYRPRIDMGLLLSLPYNDVWVTSACLGGIWEYEDAEDLIQLISNHFGQNFFLEVQYHNTLSQKILNAKILQLVHKNNYQIIAGCDSHYIYPEESQDRETYLLSKHISYENEEGWFLDYPDKETAIKRFKEQGILSESQIQKALDATNTFLEVEEYKSPVFDKDMKIPSLYPDKTQEQKNQTLRSILLAEWEKEKQNLPKDVWGKYESEIGKELNIIFETGMADYFLLDYEIVKRSKELGGHITLTGRGCFTKDALIHTECGMKTINNVEIGDSAIGSDGQFHKVYDCMKYDIDEETILIEHVYGEKGSHPYICTKDHKILIYKNNKRSWVKASEIKEGDFVCLPKMNLLKNNGELPGVIDLNDYNDKGFLFDDRYIYEKPMIGEEYEYSPSSMARKYGVGKSTFEKFANKKIGVFKRKPHILEQFLKDTPFKTQEEYAEYIEGKRTNRVNRYLHIDEVFNQFIGLMYGDGFTVKNTQIALAINAKNHKNIINRNIFEKIASRVGVTVREIPQRSACIQLIFSAYCFRRFFECQFFVSQKGRKKIFNKNLFYQKKSHLKALLQGLMLSDGSLREEYNNISFDNTSESIINAFKILGLLTGQEPMSLFIRKPWTDKRGYKCKKSYKLRIRKRCRELRKKYLRSKEDENFWYLPITKLTTLEKKKQTVYDLSVEGTNDFLVKNMIVHNSAPSFYIGKLLGFTTIDRISAPIKLFPERFITKERILDAGSLPDIDFNLGNPEVFAQAQIDIMGENHSYPMLAYGTFRPRAAWKLYARATEIDFETANMVSNQIGEYETKLKHSENPEEVDILSFISPEFHKEYSESIKYLGIVSDQKIHPCSYLLYQGNIKEEIGLIKIKKNLCCCMDGLWAEKYGFLKNDNLKVTIVELIYRTYKKVGIKPHTLSELIDICKDNKKVWEVYRNAWTMGINQVERSSTSGRVAKYAPQNISELSAFIAAIRPGFQSNYAQFEAREQFSYGVQALDSLIQTKEFPQSYMLYQENAMQVLAYAGIPVSETYDVIKNIAKKRVEKVLKVKKRFLKGMTKRLLEEEVKKEDAEKISEKTWQIIEDSSHYSFNSCVSGDTKIQKAGVKTKSFNPTVEEMFLIKNDLEYAKKTGHLHLRQKYRTKNGYGNALSMYEDLRIRKNKIIDIRYAGIRNIYRVTTDNGCFIEATENHKFPTINGEKKLKNLNVGDYLYTKGEYEKTKEKYPFTDGTTNNLPKKGQIGFQRIENGASVLYHRFREKNKKRKNCCEVCGKKYQEDIRFEVHHIDGNKLNNAISNLCWCCVSCHKKTHYQNGRTKVYGKGIPTVLSKIVSIVLVGKSKAYDIEMQAPAHTFVSESGLVTSNSHALSTAGDSLYGAYLKSHYPLEFYETFLRLLEEDGDKDRLNLARTEAIEAYGIKFPSMKFRQDNRKITANLKTGEITSSLASIKGFGSSFGETIYQFAERKYDTFIDLMIDMEENNALTSKIESLIQIGYFEEFGSAKKLYMAYQEFKSGKNRYSKRHKDTTKEKRIVALKGFFENLPDDRFPISSRIEFEHDVLGYIQATFPISKKYVFVTNVQTKFSPRIQTYCLANGIQASLKVRKKLFEKNMFYGGDILYINKFQRKPCMEFKDGKFSEKEDGSFEWWVEDYRIVSMEEFDKITQEIK